MDVLFDDQLDAHALDRERMKECFRVLDSAIDGHEFLVGDRITAADVMIAFGVGMARGP